MPIKLEAGAEFAEIWPRALPRERNEAGGRLLFTARAKPGQAKGQRAVTAEAEAVRYSAAVGGAKVHHPQAVAVDKYAESFGLLGLDDEVEATIQREILHPGADQRISGPHRELLVKASDRRRAGAATRVGIHANKLGIKGKAAMPQRDDNPRTGQAAAGAGPKQVAEIRAKAGLNICLFAKAQHRIEGKLA